MVWAVTSNGRSIPLDPDPVADGNIIIDGKARNSHGRLVPRAIVLGKADVPLDDPDRFVSHFATCVHADRFKKPKR